MTMIIVLVVALIAVVPLLIMVLWNFLAPKFGLPNLGYVECVALFLLTTLLFRNK